MNVLYIIVYIGDLIEGLLFSIYMKNIECRVYRFIKYKIIDKLIN